MKSTKCCIKCVPPKRHPGCQDRCPEYLEVAAENENERAEREARHKSENDFYNVKIARRDRYRKRVGDRR